MAEDEDISACPFCAALDLLLMEDEGVFYVMCLECRACGPCEDNKEEAMDAWGDRLDEETAELFISRAKRLTILS